MFTIIFTNNKVIFNSLFLKQLVYSLYLKCNMHMQNPDDIRSIVDASLVHCLGSCEFKPRCRTLFFFFFFLFFFFFFFFFIFSFHLFVYSYNCLNIINSKLFLLLNNSLITATVLRLSVASQLCVFVFANATFKGHFV